MFRISRTSFTVNVSCVWLHMMILLIVLRIEVCLIFKVHLLTRKAILR